MKKLALSLMLVLASSLSAIGCGSSHSNTAAGATQMSQMGVVGQLTGDPDDEVSPALQAQVSAALALGPNDEPLDF